MIEQLFFELIQIAIGNRKELRHIPSIKEWLELFDMAKKQALTAIAFMGVTKLTPVSDYGASHWPWMICEPDEKEGKFLLNEIMLAGNFGAFDQRIKRGYGLWIMGYGFNFPKGMVHAIEKTKHNFRLLSHYPEEVLWEPVFRVYHWVWRKLELWRY